VEDLAIGNISSGLRYACRHWASHLSKTQPEDGDRKHLIAEIQEWLDNRSLFWMEAMNLLKMMGECYPMLVATRRWLGMVSRDFICRGIDSSHNNTEQEELELYRNLNAAESLITVLGSNVVSKSTPHLYCSALSAASRDLTLMARWKERFPGIPVVSSLLTSTYLLLVLSHQDKVQSVGFSPDGLRAISGPFNKTVRIWEVSIGKQLIQLDGHNQWVASGSFLPDRLRAISVRTT
jgi:WD40 repeat protein